MDIDHQSSLSIVLLGAPLWERRVKDQLTVNPYSRPFAVAKSRCQGTRSLSIIRSSSVRAGKKPTKSHHPNLDFVSAQFELDDTEIDLASTNYSNPTLSEWEKRTLLASWLDKIGAADNYDYVIFDCPPATKIVSQNALSCRATSYVIPVIPTIYQAVGGHALPRARERKD